MHMCRYRAPPLFFSFLFNTYLVILSKRSCSFGNWIALVVKTCTFLFLNDDILLNEFIVLKQKPCC